MGAAPAPLLLGLAVVGLAHHGGVVAQYPPPPPAGPPPPAPNISAACLARAGPKQNHSMWHSPEFANIIGSWGVITGAPPTPFNMLAPQGAGTGEYYMCQHYDDYNFWSVSVGLPSSGGGGGRRRSGKPKDKQGHAMHDRSTNTGYMAAITDTLAGLAQHPADIATKRRRMQHHGYGGGGDSVGMCLPKECGKTDVKIITGYYYFWLKCGNVIAGAMGGGGGGPPGFRRALQHGGGPTPQMLEQLLQCGKTTCPWKGPPPPPGPKIPRSCEHELEVCYKDRGHKLECDLCLRTNKANLTNCTSADKQAFCNPPAGPPPPPFDPLHCYYEACPKHSYDDDGDGMEDYYQGDEDNYGGFVAEGRRRLFMGYGGGGECPNKEEPVPLDDTGTFWVVYICLTIFVITVASLPAPYGLRGCLPGAAGGPKASVQASTTATPRNSQVGSPLAPLASGDAKTELNASILSPPPQRPAAAPGGTAGKMFLEIMNCWSFQRNYNALFKPDPGIPGLSVLNGMRVLAIMCVVLGHTWAFMRMDVTNMQYGELVAARESAIGILGNGNVMDNGTGVSYLSVDTFFFFSGFLAFYSMLTSVTAFPSKRNSSWDTPKKAVVNSLKYTYAVVVHRYMRLTPMYFFILMVYMHVWPAIGNGPRWKEGTDMTFCNKWWWTNILYISNLYPCQTWELSSTNPDNNWGDKDYATCSNGQGELGCMIQTWYLSNDFQMFLAVVPCALLFKWKVWAAYAYNAALTGGCLWWGYANMSSHFMTMCDMMICGHSYGRRLMGADLSDPDAIDSLSDDVHRRLQGYGYGGPSFCDNPAKADVQVYYYDKPWARYPPYGVGVMLAIMLMHIRREPGVPASAVKFLSNGCPDVDNKIAKPPKFHPIVACLGWAAALGVLFYCSFGPYYAIPKTDTPHDCPWGGSYEQAPEDADGYSIGHGKRTHSFWDLTFSTCFRMWCVLYIYIPSRRVRSSAVSDDRLAAITGRGATTRSRAPVYVYPCACCACRWAMGVAWIVWSSMAEQGGPIGAFLGSSFWQPIKNLTFGVYLCHIMVIDLLYDSMGKSFDYTDYLGAYIFTAKCAITCNAYATAATAAATAAPQAVDLPLSLCVRCVCV